MIPLAEITYWRTDHPWQLNNHVEQDLIISRALVELFRDEHVCKTLAFRGGTGREEFLTGLRDETG